MCVFVLCDVQLKQLGHSVDKVEFIVMGGTFMALAEEYRDYFIRNLHDALSGHTSNNVAEAVRYRTPASHLSRCKHGCDVSLLLLAVSRTFKKLKQISGENNQKINPQ